VKARIAVAVTAALSLAGCSWSHGLYNVPLPGGANLGSHPISLTVQVADALNLVPQSGVKVNDVPVGKVTAITLSADRRSANVQIEIRGDVDLPANAVAAIAQTSLLGEKYIALSPPLDAPPMGRLANHATIGLGRTSDGVEAEQVFGALALLLNGGGVAQLHEIATSLNQVAHGHEANIRAFLANVDAVVAQLNAHRDSIASAIQSLGTLSTGLATENDTIARVLADLSPGLALLSQERDQFVTMLDALNTLSTVTDRTLHSSEEQMVGDLRALGPILDQLAQSGTDLPKSLQVLATYPFTDAAVAGIKGDYLNTFITTDFSTPGGHVYPESDSAQPLKPAPPAGLLPDTSSVAPGEGSSLTFTTGGRR
jgi:phospholipid/cholesterol/gamma-HCH transport system substrate-binding protein